jgi:glutamine kinase
MKAMVEDMAEPFNFGTKAETLARLSPLLRQCYLCDQLVVHEEKWRADPHEVCQTILTTFGDLKMAVRSSSSSEDTGHYSNAGAYLSLINVESVEETIRDAIDSVFDSYDGNAALNQHVLIQAMVEDVALAGVILTRDLDTGGPYYVINYDDYSGRTDTVTSGATSKLIMVYHSQKHMLRSPRMRKLIEVVQEIEAVTGCQELDIEFCATSSMEVYILQVRLLAARRMWETVDDLLVEQTLVQVEECIAAQMRPLEGISGTTTILGEMPDWNPAEMIGTTPHPLAFSLYKYLITNRTWSEARVLMGYRDVPLPLMVDFIGRPYIDVRLSLNSFLPADLDDVLADRLVEYQLERLASNPDFHDKIEFEVAQTCYDFNFGQYAENLLEAGFSPVQTADLGETLRGLTLVALNQGKVGLLEILALTDKILHGNAGRLPGSSLEKIRLLLDECIRFGTLPFSILARHAFIGVSLLKSLVARQILSSEDMNQFMLSIHTVAADIVVDMAAVSAGEMTRDDFLRSYGHLRPGTYDILSQRYDENPDFYLAEGEGQQEALERLRGTALTLTSSQKDRIRSCLRDMGYKQGLKSFFDYIGMAIKAREQAKFAFTRNISDALKEIERWGSAIGLKREELSYLSIESILISNGDRGALLAEIDGNRERHKLTRIIRLPHLISAPEDIYIVAPARGTPTFITGKSVTAQAVSLPTDNAMSLDGCIVLIESADPGFDWIFSHNIAGLITQFGGANSHMAIRCAEFGLPAAIGCGERLFSDLHRASVIELNCTSRKVSKH